MWPMSKHVLIQPRLGDANVGVADIFVQIQKYCPHGWGIAGTPRQIQ